MSAREFTEWMAYYRLEPFGEERADLRFAILDAITVNMHRDPKKGQMAKPKDFMPEFDKPPQTWQDQLALVETMNAVLGGADER